MNLPDLKEKWTGSINTLVIGATPEQGGTRKSTVTVGGAATLPFLDFEASTGKPPVIAVEVWDGGAGNWPTELQRAYGASLKSPTDWARKAVEFGANLICLRLNEAHPDGGNRSPEQCAQTVKDVLAAVSVPLIVWGCGIDDKDNLVMPAVSAAARGENCALGSAREKNYRTMVAVALADKHKLIAESPCDINISKQVNILCSDAGFPLTDLITFPTTGALGYGMEYVYSIQERGRLAALGGDRLLSQPILADVGLEAWRAKEAKDPPFAGVTDQTRPQWGVAWEAATAVDLLQAGVEIIVMRHPQAIQQVRNMIGRLMPQK